MYEKTHSFISLNPKDATSTHSYIYSFIYSTSACLLFGCPLSIEVETYVVTAVQTLQLKKSLTFNK